ncbi:MAG: hypothetical protein AVDCRST_MAG02-2196, partial [uncultured Rubrobacteraceae bacterium]
GREPREKPGGVEAQRGTGALGRRPGLLRPTRSAVRLDSDGGGGRVPRDRGLRAGGQKAWPPAGGALHGRHLRRPARGSWRGPRRRLRPGGRRLVPEHAHGTLHRGL